MTSTTRIPASLAAAALATFPAACVFDEGSSLHRDSTVEMASVEGHPSCAAAGYPDAIELTIYPAASGTVTHESGLAITVETEGTYFDFSASPGVDAVIASQGTAATIYQYTPPALGDASLSAPISPTQADRPGALDRVTFCRAAIGCTLTASYWRDHSELGSQRFDDTWAQLPGGASTAFFRSGQSYHDVLWASPDAGNPYYRLAQAYVAAELSQLAGADADAVALPFAEATEILEAYTPAEVAELPSSSPLRSDLLAVTGALDDYVHGHIGPGHCEASAR